MNEVFTEEDIYCIENFGYNTTGEYDKIKQLEDKDHLVVEELEYRLKQKENILKKVEKYLRSNEWAIDYEHSNCRTHLLRILKEG